MNVCACKPTETHQRDHNTSVERNERRRERRNLRHLYDMLSKHPQASRAQRRLASLLPLLLLVTISPCSTLPAPTASGSASSPVSCVDETGAAVDWWFMIKHPKYNDKPQKECVGNCDGDTYVYVTSVHPQTWLVGTEPVSSSTGSLLGAQLKGIYNGSVNNYVFYNDQLPDGSWSTVYGHSKGVFAFDNDSAYFVQHSIPKFPNYVKDGYLYGSGQMWYGQHAFCMTLTPKALDAIAGVMRYANPQVFDHALSDTSLSNVNQVAAMKSSGGTTHTTVSAGWADLTLFGKDSACDEDMLDSLASPGLKTTLLSQSWLNSGGPIGGYCPSSGVDVFDILQLQLPGAKPADTHATYEDHSKWAVAKDDGSPWWCALDNNHVASQLTRSGLAVCWQNADIAALLRGVATETGPCGAPSPPTPKPGSCCFYDDTKCVSGQICCSSSTKKSYKSESTCYRYGDKHHCVWEASTNVCDIP